MVSQRTFGNYLQASLNGALFLFYFDRLFEFNLPYELLRRIELFADLRILRLDGEHLLQISNGQLRLQYLYMTHRTAAGGGSHVGSVSRRVSLKGQGCVRGCYAADVPVVRFSIFRVQFYCARCDRSIFSFSKSDDGKGGGEGESAENSQASCKAYPCSSSLIRVYARLQNNVASLGLRAIASEYNRAARGKSWAIRIRCGN